MSLPNERKPITRFNTTQSSDNTRVERQIDTSAVQISAENALLKRRSLGLPDDATDEEVKAAEEQAQYIENLRPREAYIGPSNYYNLSKEERQRKEEDAAFRLQTAQHAKDYNRYAEALGFPTVDPETVSVKDLNQLYRNMGGLAMGAGLGAAGAVYAPVAIPAVGNFVGELAGSMALGKTVDWASQQLTGYTPGENLRNFVSYYTGFNPDNPWWTAGTDIVSNPFYFTNPTSLGNGVNYYLSQFQNNWIPNLYSYAVQNPEITAGVASGLLSHVSPEFGSAVPGGYWSTVSVVNKNIPNLTERYPKLVKRLQEFKSKGAPIARKVNLILEKGTPQQIADVEKAIGDVMKERAVIDKVNSDIIGESLPAKATSSKSLGKAISDQNKKVINNYNATTDTGIYWDADDWFMQGGRTKTPGPLQYTQADVETFYNHVANEYLDLQNTLINSGKLIKKNGVWLGEINGNYTRVRPQEYIVAHSKAFQKAGLYYDGQNYYSGIPSEYLESFSRGGGTYVENWASTNKTVANTYGNKFGGKQFDLVSIIEPKARVTGGKSSNSFMDNQSIGSVLKNKYDLKEGEVIDAVQYVDDLTKKLNNVKDQDATGTTRIFMPGVQVKALRGNNGNFDMQFLNPFAYNPTENNNFTNLIT